MTPAMHAPSRAVDGGGDSGFVMRADLAEPPARGRQRPSSDISRSRQCAPRNRADSRPASGRINRGAGPGRQHAPIHGQSPPASPPRPWNVRVALPPPAPFSSPSREDTMCERQVGPSAWQPIVDCGSQVQPCRRSGGQLAASSPWAETPAVPNRARTGIGVRCSRSLSRSGAARPHRRALAAGAHSLHKRTAIALSEPAGWVARVPEALLERKRGIACDPT